ncbi:Hsp70 family protein [Dactylosporangium sp. CA-139066]|uniref:Hsp70 family protein n=1 Tax=Dactylosporangium sp. CA-139066 TaxID=3239930 RepID=UPI003D944D8C
MDARGYRLGVDFGTSNTVAMLAWPDGHVRPLLFDGSPTLPSSVFADAASGLLVGRDAMHAARINPERYEPNPKRRIDEAAVLLGEQEVATVDLIAAVLARVAGEARRVSGVALGPVTVTCPAAWAQTRRGVLLAAAERAGLGAVTLLPEPVAAAQVFRTLTGADAPRALPGSAFVVYDLGAGTFDASVVRTGSGAFEVLASEGLSTSGGLDIDAAIVGFLGATHGARDPEAWRRLTHPGTSGERRANRMLWDDVRSAKEMLSRTASTMIHIPALETDVPLGRDQFEQLARPILSATVTTTRAAIAAAGLGLGDVEGVFLVGGGSRIPLVATLLHQALGKAPTVVEQPELVVAQGAVGASVQFTLPGAAASVSAPPGLPTSSVPASGVPSAPVSPAFMAAPVTGYPVSPAAAAGYGGAPAARSSAGPASPPSSGPPAVVAPGPGSGVPGAGVSGRAVAGGGVPGGGVPGGRGPGGGGAGGAPGGKGRRGGVPVAAAVAVLLVLGLGTYGAIRLFGGKSGDGGSGDGNTANVAADLEHSDVDWSSTAEAYDGQPDKTVGYNCPSGGFIGTVWGSGPYTTDSSVCTAAVHAGKITLESGGRVVIKIRTGADSYEGTTQHEISTTSYDAFPWAFDVVS